VCWKLEPRGGKLTKPPYQVGGRRKADSTKPATWDSFDACWASAFMDGCTDGIGVVVDGSDDLMAADLDHCIDEDGRPEAWAREIVRRLDSYTEVSPSGTGLRVFFRSTKGQDWGCDEKGQPLDGRKLRREAGHLELYRAKRYLTVTGDHLDGTPETINHVALETIADLLGPPRTNGSAGDARDDVHAGGEFPDELRDRLNEAMATDPGYAPLGMASLRTARIRPARSST